jgi:hypothetical protein
MQVSLNHFDIACLLLNQLFVCVLLSDMMMTAVNNVDLSIELSQNLVELLVKQCFISILHMLLQALQFLKH